MKVIHPSFGNGQVVSQDEKNVTVNFNGLTKILVTKFSKLTNEDGTPFGTQAVATEKKRKKTSAEKRMAWERTLTEDKKRELRFENPDGSFNVAAYDKFMEEQEKKKWASKSW